MIRSLLAILLLTSTALADEVKLRLDRPSEVVITTDASGKITVAIRPIGPTPPPGPDNPTPVPPGPDPQPTPPGPELTGLAKIARDAAAPLRRPTEARTIAGLYRSTAAQIAAGAGDPQALLNELGVTTKSTLGVAWSAWIPVVQQISAAMKAAGFTSTTDIAQALRDLATGLEAA